MPVTPQKVFGYYLHVEPGSCHAGAALFQPSKAALARLRMRLVDDPEGLKDLLADREFKKDFPRRCGHTKSVGRCAGRLRKQRSRGTLSENGRAGMPQRPAGRAPARRRGDRPADRDLSRLPAQLVRHFD